ncbi:MAG: hypothetical protein ACRC3G_06940, partial [Bacteroidales bacterium]
SKRSMYFEQYEQWGSDAVSQYTAGYTASLSSSSGGTQNFNSRTAFLTAYNAQKESITSCSERFYHNTQGELYLSFEVYLEWAHIGVSSIRLY